ncbi:MAG: redoxin domain-containing protein [Phycisphaerae bacterium]|jgi:thiol-disulfide isomerase/thioredoxin/outer membrane lipoprotein-sorting protein
MRTILCGCLLLTVFPASAPAAEKTIPGLEGLTRKVITRAVEVYRSAKTYQDRSVRSTDFELESEPKKPPALGRDVEAAFYHARPGRFRYESADLTLVCDGRTFWHHQARLGQYIRTRAPERWSFDREDEESLRAKGLLHRPAQSMLSNLPVEELFKEVARFESARPVEHREKKAIVVHGVMRQPPDDEEVPFDFWFDEASGVLMETAFDVTGPMAALKQSLERQEGVRVKRIISRIRYLDVKLDEPIPEVRFTFNPAEEDEKVDEFSSSMDARMARQKKLLGKPAPAIRLKDLAGRTVGLEDFKGKVVFIDFWATWCGPCVAAIPGVQKLHEKFKDHRDVVVLGVNCDDPEDEQTVRDFLKEKKITFAQILDSDGKARLAYSVPGIPCTVVIDRKGLIASIEVGGHDLEEMSAWVNAALKGQSAGDEKEK